MAPSPSPSPSPSRPLVLEDTTADMDKHAPYHSLETPRAANAAATDASVHVLTAETIAGKPEKMAETGSNEGTAAKAEPPPSFAFASLYRYATRRDKLLLALGVLAASVNGALFPLMAIIFGDVLSGFVTSPIDQDAVNAASLNFLLLAVGLFVTEYVSYISFYHTAERQMRALRSAALQHMLYLDISWYDQHDALQLSSRLSGDTVKIKEGMGQKLGDMFRFTMQFIVGFCIGFARGWDLSLVMMAIVPFMAITLMWLIKTMRAKSEWAQKVYAEAGAVAEETIGQMRTVASVNGEPRALQRYKTHVARAEAENIQLAKYVSVVFAMFMGSVWVMYSVGLWYGGKRVSDGALSPSEVFSAFFGILVGSASLAQISPNITAVAQATGAAQALFTILDTPSAIDASRLDEGDELAHCAGAISVRNVHFCYPTRPEAPVLVNYSLEIPAGATVAFVGASGCGKSTLVALLERFYDPQEGQILLDGHDIRSLNVTWLRRQIGIVQQEPVLFQTSIVANILMGVDAAADHGDGKRTIDAASREKAMAAAKMANAHTFIMALPQQYDTLVGEKGVSLSGGQKQRVAIARAIVRNPKILVLDEATSALDNESERVVQHALNELMAQTSMTTLVIAHRLSTVRHADKIVVLRDGHLIESGVHDELLAIEDGLYRNMFKMQELRSKEADNDDEDNREDEANVIHDEEPTIEDGKVLRSSLRDRSRSSRSSAHSARSDASLALVEDNTLKREPINLMDIMRFSAPERKYMYSGILGALVTGASMPASALLVSGMITSMTQEYGKWLSSDDRSHLDTLYHDVRFYGICYLIGAVVLMFFIWLQFYSFKFMMEKLVTRLRTINFSAVCRQNIGFFDEKENATGALTADLNTNATKVSLLSGDSLARVVQAAFTLIAAVSISFALGSWLLTLVMLAVMPLLIAGQWARMRLIIHKDAISDELAEPGAHASERLSNIRTVVSLGLEKASSEKFAELLDEPMKKGHRLAQINGLSLGFSSFIMMAVYALVFWYGGKLVDQGDASFLQVMRTLMAITMSIQGVTGAASYFSDLEAATKAASTIMALKNRHVPIDAFDTTGFRGECVSDGQLVFRDVSFRYPTRSEVSVLKKFSLTIEAGQTVAFCGPSGGGKSTVVSLIERFYDPVHGSVSLDGRDLRGLNVSWLRDQIGLVGQEPVLFSGSISDNIALGLTTKPSVEEIEAAAKMANAHDFIVKFPDGYDTQVGNKGEQLSGGQKQRLAIARAILKDPPILLLDEATSALDSESEKVVQDALDKVVALKRRTTVIIAHRLSTIRKADKICVVSGGRIAEQGTHTELLARDGIYTTLVKSASA